MESRDSKRDLYTDVLSSIIHKSQEVEIIHINGLMDKQSVYLNISINLDIYINVVLFSLKKNGNSDICHNNG